MTNELINLIGKPLVILSAWWSMERYTNLATKLPPNTVLFTNGVFSTITIGSSPPEGISTRYVTNMLFGVVDGTNKQLIFEVTYRSGYITEGTTDIGFRAASNTLVRFPLPGQ